MKRDITFWAFTAFTVFVVALVLWGGWAIYKEATFDYTVCDPSSTYVDKHTAAWSQWMPRTCVNNVCTGGYSIYHPERNWTERLYSCPDEGDWFDKWRVENRGGAQ